MSSPLGLALGASRGRIVMQLFVEVLVLAAGAGIAGFLLARELSGRLAGIVMPTMDPGNLPFWMDFKPSLATVLCVSGSQRAGRRDCGCCAGVSRHRTMAAQRVPSGWAIEVRALVWGRRGRHCWPRKSRCRWRSCRRASR